MLAGTFLWQIVVDLQFLGVQTSFFSHPRANSIGQNLVTTRGSTLCAGMAGVVQQDSDDVQEFSRRSRSLWSSHVFAPSCLRLPAEGIQPRKFASRFKLTKSQLLSNTIIHALAYESAVQ